jgi:mannitol-1-/sugar-/sorbitol-6-phosphatase
MISPTKMSEERKKSATEKSGLLANDEQPFHNPVREGLPTVRTRCLIVGLDSGRSFIASSPKGAAQAPDGREYAFMRGHFIPLTLTCRAVLFDMDGTLVDSTRVVERAWGWWAKRHDIPLEEVLSFSHGRPTIATMERFLPGRDHAQEVDEMDRYEETELEGIVAVPGAMQAVRALQKHPWAIVTSAWRTLAQARLSAAGLPVPKVLVPADEIRNGKPNPEGFLRAAELLGAPPEEAWSSKTHVLALKPERTRACRSWRF